MGATLHIRSKALAYLLFLTGCKTQGREPHAVARGLMRLTADALYNLTDSTPDMMTGFLNQLPFLRLSPTAKEDLHLPFSSRPQSGFT
ncbi:hypothetical protein NDU88_000239 [Pleurodeles waltl]|uniref:Uncharacterized protein n=1 Tax=Pleurodeles waltl TaxID=8319 RepID=A0AAV7VVJ0_PLEWA|nr:hypothetical protein NDU88_000239 [Pleurodeles waltl]